MTAAADPFAEPDLGVPRGRYGRPLIIPAGRGGKPNLKAKLVEYDRASTVAGALADGDALAKWQTRHAALGVAISPDLAAMAAALGRNLNAFTPEDKENLDAIIARAHDRSGGNEKADYGTAVHSLTEPGNDGVAILSTTDDDGTVHRMADDVASYVATLDEAGIEVDATETFVVNDELKVAGTFDHAYRLTRDLACKVNGEPVELAAGTKLLGDKKTGSLHFDEHAIQLAIYARGKKYVHQTGERIALDVSPQWGIVAHVARQGAKTTLYLVNLHEGWQGAKLAVEVRAYKLGARKRLSVAIAQAEAPGFGPDPEGDAAVDAIPDRPPLKVVEPVVVEPVVVDGLDHEPTVIEAPVEPVEPNFGDAIVNLRNAGLEPTDQLMHAIAAAADAVACRALYRAHRAAWRPEHTAAVEKRVAEGMPERAE